MIATDLCLPIDLPWPIENFNFPNYRNKNQSQTKLHNSMIDKSFLTLMREKYLLDIQFIEIFYLPCYSSHAIHCDGHELDNKAKVNFVKDGRNSKMIWYSAKEDNLIETGYTKVNTKYLSIKEHNCKIIHSEKIISPCLVNVGQFHTVRTVDQERFCLSLAFIDLTRKYRLNFSELAQRFKI